MTNNKTVYILLLSLLIAPVAFFGNFAEAQAPVAVKAYAVHTGENIQYHYQVTNKTRARNIHSVSIGNRGEQGDDPATQINEKPELSIYPTDSFWGPPSELGDDRGYSPRLGGIFTTPYGWGVSILGYSNGWPDISPRFSIEWGKVAQTGPSILPGQTFNFSVTIAKSSVIDRNPNIVYGGHGSERYLAKPYLLGDPAYLNGHFTVGFLAGKSTDEGPAHWEYTGQIESLDTTAPVLSTVLTPATLGPPNEKLIPIAVTITVKDDYDPQPEIKLESITANEPLEKEDIKDAKIGTDDRQFKLKAEREGKNKAGRIYTVTYSATDATGNKATASATVTVPHDERKKGYDKDEREK